MRRIARTSIALLASAALARAQTEEEVKAIWKDPQFQRQFIGSYGINADVEPRVTPEEVALLEKVRPLMADDLPKAEEALKTAMKPDCSAILDFTLGGIRFQQDKLIDALDDYRRAVGKFPSFRRAWRNLGLLNVRNGNHDAAIASFTQMIQLGGGDAYSYGLLGFAYASKQDYQAAEAAFRTALLLQPDNTEWRLGLTRCVFRQERFEDAASLLEVLIARYPDKAEFWMLQAQAFNSMKQPLRAAQDLEAVDRLGKSTLDTLQSLGGIYTEEGLFDLAESAFERAVDLDPKQPLDRPLQGVRILASRGANAEARRLATHLHTVFDAQMQETDRRELLKTEARISMAEGGGDAHTAEVLEELVKLDPLDGDALMLLGQHYAKNGEPDRALLDYERAGNLPKFEVNAKLRAAQVLVGMGRYQDALPLLRRVQEVQPRDDVGRYLESVERLARARK
jgi:tetratricopeptide (TPR) repeat protein